MGRGWIDWGGCHCHGSGGDGWIGRARGVESFGWGGGSRIRLSGRQVGYCSLLLKMVCEIGGWWTCGM